MTTTQTIDGVPRHTLRLALAGIEYLALRADDIGTSSVQLAAELRALLDAPVPFPGYPPVPEDRKLPSARPQGEPAAWMCQRRTHESGRKFLPLISFDKWTNCPDDFDVWPLYRHPPEQPAPVALDVLITGFYTTESGGGKYAINIGFRSMADMQAADAQLRELLKSR